MRARTDLLPAAVIFLSSSLLNRPIISGAPPAEAHHRPEGKAHNAHSGREGCLPWTFPESRSGIPPEHADGACDLTYENDFRRRKELFLSLRHSVETGGMRRLGEERTWVCPEDDANAAAAPDGATARDEDGTPIHGPSSVWLFRNEATKPVVVSRIDPNNGREVSAFHPEIAPAHLDPEAVVAPGQWRSVDVLLGHVFQARELVADGPHATGRVLLRHRPGPIPVTGRQTDPRLACPTERARNGGATPGNAANKRRRRRHRITSDAFDNLMSGELLNRRRCNSLHRVFVNRVGCPVDVYYAGVAEESQIPSSIYLPADKGGQPPTNSTKGEEVEMSESCRESFKFHLGINLAYTDDYDSRWDSPVSFEATYLGHKFIARLHHNPDIVVDEIVIERTVIRDCPTKNQKNVSAIDAMYALGETEEQMVVDATGNLYPTKNVRRQIKSDN
eukprot:CAMPEP_0183295188 /NCGR_PEP_ID=MMETSP0160_2-20130417/3237_1 /TAXON_ID=2839 ORGANISM="Odontella Sinensis, Strain Grunow 1884" /NCGR_SAMPLE_ID=MMETSP0160_2 /ASSEMBLY_ACC=CAM_ASM_000250 /LENGTH=447 /DNA_ID=CAMNT_0025456627 /DNA_START=32 /DNA_END=1375 /DNA_ORIENTATION=-